MKQALTLARSIRAKTREMIMKRWLLLASIILSSGSAATHIAVADVPEGINLRRTVTVEVVEKTKDAVVNIAATKLISKRISPFGNDPFLPLFGGGQVVRVPANALGSGFIIHRDGYVVTNNHVIDRARQITVELADGRKLPAELISSDPDADLAVLKISSDHPFPTLALGDSSDLMIGEPVIAVGNPLGYSHTVSTGIVSAVHRDLKDEQEPKRAARPDSNRRGDQSGQLRRSIAQRLRRSDRYQHGGPQ